MIMTVSATLYSIITQKEIPDCKFIFSQVNNFSWCWLYPHCRLGWKGHAAWFSGIIFKFHFILQLLSVSTSFSFSFYLVIFSVIWVIHSLTQGLFFSSLTFILCIIFSHNFFKFFFFLKSCTFLSCTFLFLWHSLVLSFVVLLLNCFRFPYNY